MRNVVLYELVSLDGVAEEPGEGNWFIDADQRLMDNLADLKRRAGGDIGIHGSLTPARALLREHLVDELRLVVSPSLAGGGRRLFDDTGDLQRFSLVSADRSGGCLLLHYRRRDA